MFRKSSKKVGEVKGNAHILLELAEMAEKEGWSGPRDLAGNHNAYVAKAIVQDLERIHRQHTKSGKPTERALRN